MHTLFTYGLLMDPEFTSTLIGHAPKGHPGRLEGYRKYALKEREYPGIKPEAGAQVEGVVFAGLSDDDMAKLDDFEGDEYERIEVSVACGGGAITAWVYVLGEGFYGIVEGE